MSSPLTRTSILLPKRRADTLSRKRLLDLLYDLLDQNLIIVTAPAGYGKTTLLVDMAHQLDMPVCWYTISALDRDPRRFITQFIAALSHIFSKFGRQSSAVLHGASAVLDWNQIVTTITNEIYESIQEHFVLVLDDFHFTDGSEQVSNFISLFAQQVDENCHLVIASRTLPIFPDISLMVARNQVGGLDFKSLAFRAYEIRALIKQNYNLAIPESEAETLELETEGWITGLLLSAHTMWHGMIDRIRLAHASGIGLYDYLAHQVLEQQEYSLREFLLRTSLLEEFDAELCSAVLEQGAYLKGRSWQDLINAALQSNLFIQPVSDDGQWVRYHHLFEEFLQEQMTHEYPDETDGILRRLATEYTERGEWEKAHQLYQRLEDIEATIKLIEQTGLALLRSGRQSILADWIDTLPRETLSTHPGLASLRGGAAVDMGEVAYGLALLCQAEEAFRAENDIPYLAYTLVQKANAQRLLGKYQSSLAAVDEALALTRQTETLLSVRTSALRVKGLCLRRLGLPREARDCLKDARTYYKALGDSTGMAVIHSDLGMVFHASGAYQEAEQAYNCALAYWREVGNIAQQATALNNLGVLFHQMGRYTVAGAILEEAVVFSRRGGYTRMEAQALTSIGDLYSDLMTLQAALDAYVKAYDLAKPLGDKFLQYYIAVARAVLSILEGELQQAREFLESAYRIALASGSSYELGLYQLEAGRLALAEGLSAEALKYLEKSVLQFNDNEQLHESARAYLYLAIAHDAASNRGGSVAALEHVFRLTPSLQSQKSLLPSGRDAKKLLEKVRNEPKIGREASQFLKQVIQFESAIPVYRRSLRKSASAAPLTPPKLTIRALGKASVELDGETVATSDWQTQGARDLFFLILSRPLGLTKEAVGSILWPESPPARSRLNFKKTLYRLRRALFKGAVIFVEDDGIYQFNWAMDYNYDVETFREELVLAREASSSSNMVSAYRVAIDLYQGPYLPVVAGTWVHAEREALRQDYQEAILKVARLYSESQQYELALHYCRRALAGDPCLEEAHRLAMHAHAAMGNRAAIVRQFKLCRRDLREELDISPSPQTEQLYEALVSI
jgi:ATP/maltotriose-dependent transcriptional regulator MalT/DNA-binding SARP family transcriptional activator